MALISPCPRRGVEEINRHSWQIIRRLDEMIAAFPISGKRRAVAGCELWGTALGRRRIAVGAAGQAGRPQHQLHEGDFGVALRSIGLGAGGAAFREAVLCLFLVKSRSATALWLCH